MRIFARLPDAMKPASITILLCFAALPMLAAPGPFTLTGSAQCNGPTPHIALTWNASAGAASYDIYRNGGNFARRCCFFDAA